MWRQRERENAGHKTKKATSKCFSCDESGHIARDCRLKKNGNKKMGDAKGVHRCFNCGKVGHMASDCTKKREMTSEDRPETAVVTTLPSAIPLALVTKAKYRSSRWTSGH